MPPEWTGQLRASQWYDDATNMLVHTAVDESGVTVCESRTFDAEGRIAYIVRTLNAARRARAVPRGAAEQEGERRIEGWAQPAFGYLDGVETPLEGCWSFMQPSVVDDDDRRDMQPATLILRSTSEQRSEPK